MIGLIFNTILYQPLLNALILLYSYLPGHDFGIAILALTCIIRILLFPSTLKSIKAQRALQAIQPKIKEIQDKYKGSKDQQAKAMMELYKEEKISPLSGCLPMLLQLPILIALFLVFRDLAGNLGSIDKSLFYSFVPYSGEINIMFLGRLNLTEPSSILAFLAGISQFFQMKMINPQKSSSGKKSDFSQVMQKQMLYMFPLFTVLILWKLPSAIGIYWLTTSLFSVGQQYLASRSKHVN